MLCSISYVNYINDIKINRWKSKAIIWILEYRLCYVYLKKKLFTSFYLRKKKDFSIYWFTFQISVPAKTRSAEMSSLELSPDLPQVWQKSTHLGHHLLPPRVCISSNWTQTLGSPVRDVEICYNLTAAPMSAPASIFVAMSSFQILHNG